MDRTPNVMYKLIKEMSLKFQKTNVIMSNKKFILVSIFYSKPSKFIHTVNQLSLYGVIAHDWILTWICINVMAHFRFTSLRSNPIACILFNLFIFYFFLVLLQIFVKQLSCYLYIPTKISLYFFFTSSSKNYKKNKNHNNNNQIYNE